jgi:gluconokinase
MLTAHNKRETRHDFLPPSSRTRLGKETEGNSILKNQIVIVMGVSGSGKTSVAEGLARLCEIKFIDADDLHPRRNVEKMSKRIPLDEDDRQPWLERVSDAIFSLQKRNASAVIACSALKRKYRDQIRHGNAAIRFLFLKGDYQTIWERMSARPGHFMSPEMLQGQFKTLEDPLDELDVVSIGIAGTLSETIERAAEALGSREG